MRQPSGGSLSPDRGHPLSVWCVVPSMREFVLSYQFGNQNWMVGIAADSPEDAARRVQAIRRSGILLGFADRFTPVEVEYRDEQHEL